MRLIVSSSAMKRPSAFLRGIVISWPSVKPFVQSVVAFSTRRRWSRRMNCWCALRVWAPGMRRASASIWKPLQMPSTGMPLFAASTTSVMIGLRLAMAPARR
ncbi:hypothetical protein AX769_02015 [Frondihabitans sp. PAMC 28766]|nr:hypothetical protein AX769_02015 [Frondihabitans sp. PAMC 28766]